MTDTNWYERLEELTHPQQAVLDEDLASLRKLSERVRIEKYNELKRNEEEFVWEVSEEVDLTEAERDDVRGRFRLARLLLAASFYADGDLPAALEGDFVEDELQAVVEFDRYKQFDALTADQIEQKVRRMDGEVYELVTEYHATQLSNIDELVENPDVQQDVVEQLLSRYEDRFEKVRQGFFVYVEAHGLEHVVESIEDAVRAVANSSDTRETVQRELDDALSAAGEILERDVRRPQETLAAELREVTRRLQTADADPDALAAELQRIDDRRDDILEAQRSASERVEERVERAEALADELQDRAAELERVREAAERPDVPAGDAATELVDAELESLREQRERLDVQVSQLRRERDRMAAARERLERRRADLEGRLDEGGVPDRADLGEDAVSAEMARLLEFDYVGRFDTAMHEASSVYTPDGPVEVPDGYWDGRRERSDEHARLTSLLPADADPERFPTNRSVTYRVTSDQYFGLSSSTDLVVEARVRSDLDAHAANGFDPRPADLDTLLAVVNDVVATAEETDTPHLVGLVSPTGWADRVVDQVADDDVTRSRYSRYVSVCLVDLRDGSVVYDDADDLARENASLFELELDGQRVRDCVDVIEAEYAAAAGVDSVLAEEVVSTHDFDASVVGRAFDELADRGVGRKLRVDGVGTALDFEG